MNYAPNNGCDDCAVFSESVEETAYCEACSDVMREMKEAMAFYFIEASSPKNGAKERAIWSERYMTERAALKELEG